MTTDDNLLHRIIAHRSAPGTYDPPTPEDMMRRIQDDAEFIDHLLDELRIAKERITYLETNDA